MGFKILIAEDNYDIAEVVGFGVRMMWPDCQVTIAGSGEEALRTFEQEHPDLVMLDVSMPPPDGFEVCRRIRETSQVPILMLTVRDTTLDKVRALDLGADDYLTKPFEPAELMARLRALVRRSSHLPEAHSAQFTAGDLSIDFASHKVYIRDELVRLTPTEYRLLEVLVRHAGTILSHRFLLEQVWGSEYVGNLHYLKAFIRRLRQKLGDDAEQPRYIRTEWGMGYRFVLPQD